MKNLLSIILVTTLLVGCASSRHMPKTLGIQKNYQERVEHFNSQQCCMLLNELTITPLVDEISMTMDENKDLVTINGVKTNYMLFELPEKKGTYYYGLRSFYVEHKFAYIPTITALDKEFKVMDSTHSSYIEYQHQSLVWDDSHFWLYFKFNTEANPKPKYFLVHFKEEIGSKFQTIPRERTNVETTFINGQPISYAQNSTSFSFPTLVSPSGVLHLQKLNAWNKPINDSIFYSF